MPKDIPGDHSMSYSAGAAGSLYANAHCIRRRLSPTVVMPQAWICADVRFA
jgi:hypothetical protein